VVWRSWYSTETYLSTAAFVADLSLHALLHKLVALPPLAAVTAAAAAVAITFLVVAIRPTLSISFPRCVVVVW
jgi:hypothetical protein